MMSKITSDIEKRLSTLGKDIQHFVDKLVPIDQVERDFKPDCDVVESAGHFKILVDLPGLKKEQVKLTLKGEVLTIEGEREIYLEDGESIKREERKQGGFIRSFAIPEYADKSSIKADFKDGVLTIEISKKNDGDAEASTIPIQ